MSPIQYLKANGYNPEKVIEIKSLNISDYSFDKIIKNIDEKRQKTCRRKIRFSNPPLK